MGIPNIMQFLRYILMSIKRNKNLKTLRISIAFEGMLEIYTNHQLLENYDCFDRSNTDFLLNVAETNKFVGSSNVIYIHYE